MIEVFSRLIIAKIKTFSMVPAALQPDVEALLMRKGYDTNGDKLVSV